MSYDCPVDECSDGLARPCDHARWSAERIRRWREGKAMSRDARAISITRPGRRTASPDLSEVDLDLSEADLRRAFDALEGVPGAGPARRQIAEAIDAARRRAQGEEARRREQQSREAADAHGLFEAAKILLEGVPGHRQWYHGQNGDVLLPT